MAARTSDSTEGRTDEEEEEEEEEEAEEEAETEAEEEADVLPPCRAASLYLANCPGCGRLLSLKTLRYSHQCKSMFRVDERAREQQLKAEAAVLKRMGRADRQLEHQAVQRLETEQRQTHTVEQHMAQAAEDKRRKYASLLKF